MPDDTIMDQKRQGFQGWMNNASGQATAINGLLVVILVMAETSNKLLSGLFEQFALPAWWSQVTVIVLATTFLIFLLRSRRHYFHASRLQRPEAFILHPTSPQTLIGRDDDLKHLLSAVEQHRLVLLDGESGCGKSALVSAGLVPRLREGQGLLPVAIREWGADWVRGPLANALESLFQAPSPDERERLGWHTAFRLGAETEELADELAKRLQQVFDTLGRCVLLIADQFDDYQARHRSLFLDADLGWLTPRALAAANPFWSLVSAGLHGKCLHMLVIARSDTATGMSCLRFISNDELVSARPLARVDADCMQTLLESITGNDPDKVVISHPEGGWLELRKRLELDLKAKGAILMQQVRTVMLGLRQLPFLTLNHYQDAGGLHGVETLVISRALRRAGEAAGGANGQRVAGEILGRLVSPGGPDQPPKARRASFRELCAIVGDSATTSAILHTLQHDEVIRPAEELGGESAWQLDHDYLANAVLAQTKKADRWAIALREGRQAFDDAGSSLRKRYKALMPVSILARLCWERMRRRLRFGADRRYAVISAIKPVTVAAILAYLGTTSYLRHQEGLLTADAERLVRQFSNQGNTQSVLDIWQAPEPLRRSVLDLMRHDPGRMQDAVTGRWHWAHTGLEASKAHEVSAVLSQQLQQVTTPSVAESLAQAYAAIARRLDEPATIKAEATALRARLQRERQVWIVAPLAGAYTAAASMLHDPDERRRGIVALRTRLAQDLDASALGVLARCYATMIGKMDDAAAVRSEAAALRDLLARPAPGQPADHLLAAYDAAIGRLAHLDQVTSEAAALRAVFERPERAPPPLFANAYAIVAPHLDDASEVAAALAAVRRRLEGMPDNPKARPLTEAYARLALRQARQADWHGAITLLRTRMERQLDVLASNDYVPDDDVTDPFEYWRALEDMNGLLPAYKLLTAQLADADIVKDELIALRARLAQNSAGIVGNTFKEGYVAMAARLTRSDDIRHELAALRPLLTRHADPVVTAVHTVAYVAVAKQLHDVADIHAEAQDLRTLLADARHWPNVRWLATAYATVTERMNDVVGLRAESAALRLFVIQERRPEFGAVGKAYATMVARLNDAPEVGNAFAMLHSRLKQKIRDPGYLTDTMEGCAILALRLNDAHSIGLGASILQDHIQASAYVDRRLYTMYASLAAKQDDRMKIKHAAAFLREQLARRNLDEQRAGILAASYATVTRRLEDADDVRAEVTALRNQLDQGPPGIVARAYAVVAPRLGSQDLREEMGILRTRLQNTGRSDEARGLAQAYASVARTLLRQATKDEHAALAKEILTLAGQPFLDQRNGVIGALAPVARIDFGEDVNAAVQWAGKSFGLKPEQLRPPLPSQ